MRSCQRLATSASGDRGRAVAPAPDRGADRRNSDIRRDRSRGAPSPRWLRKRSGDRRARRSRRMGCIQQAGSTAQPRVSSASAAASSRWVRWAHGARCSRACRRDLPAACARTATANSAVLCDDRLDTDCISSCRSRIGRERVADHHRECIGAAVGGGQDADIVKPAVRPKRSWPVPVLWPNCQPGGTAPRRRACRSASSPSSRSARRWNWARAIRRA
jgi:hypothetical protein